VALLMASMTCAMVCGRGEELPKIAARKLLMPLAAHAGCDAPAISDVGELIGAASAVRAVRGHCGAIAVATSRFCGGEAPETFDGAARPATFCTHWEGAVSSGGWAAAQP